MASRSREAARSARACVSVHATSRSGSGLFDIGEERSISSDRQRSEIGLAITVEPPWDCPKSVVPEPDRAQTESKPNRSDDRGKQSVGQERNGCCCETMTGRKNST